MRIKRKEITFAIAGVVLGSIALASQTHLTFREPLNPIVEKQSEPPDVRCTLDGIRNNYYTFKFKRYEFLREGCVIYYPEHSIPIKPIPFYRLYLDRLKRELSWLL